MLCALVAAAQEFPFAIERSQNMGREYLAFWEDGYSQLNSYYPSLKGWGSRSDYFPQIYTDEHGHACFETSSEVNPVYRVILPEGSGIVHISPMRVVVIGGDSLCMEVKVFDGSELVNQQELLLDYCSWRDFQGMQAKISKRATVEIRFYPIDTPPATNTVRVYNGPDVVFRSCTFPFADR